MTVECQKFQNVVGVVKITPNTPVNDSFNFVNKKLLI